jgi:hypothetical protein
LRGDHFSSVPGDATATARVEDGTSLAGLGCRSA